MPDSTANRRLATILVADVDGYSRLMRADEEGTLVDLRAHLAELVAPVVERFHGRIVKTVGDGVLVEFCLLYTSPSPRDGLLSRMPSSA